MIKGEPRIWISCPLGSEVKVAVLLPGHAPCEECGGAAVAELDADDSWVAFELNHVHEITCSEVACDHGTPWVHACELCDRSGTHTNAPN